MFMLINETNVSLAHINVRTEKHGPADIDAVDLDLHMTGENRKMLGLLHPGLCDALYHCADDDAGQATIDGVQNSVPDLRFPKLPDSIGWSDEATGVDLTFIYGLGDDRSNIKLEDGKASVKRFEVEQGGSVTIVFRYSVAGYPDGVIDKLRKKLKQEVTITMVRPERLRQDAIDGTVGHPGLAAAKKAEEAGQQSLQIDGSGAPTDPTSTFVASATANAA